MSATLSISKATIGDCKIISDLAVRIWKKHYPDIISMEQIEYMLRLMYSEDALIKQMQEGQEFYLLSDNNKQIGYISFTHQGSGDYFLHKFYLENENQGKGTGTFFFREMLNRLDQPVTIRLTVNRQNFKSINFYFKNGFIIEKVADFDIGNGFVMNDFVMLRRHNA